MGWDGNWDSPIPINMGGKYTPNYLSPPVIKNAYIIIFMLWNRIFISNKKLILLQKVYLLWEVKFYYEKLFTNALQ